MFIQAINLLAWALFPVALIALVDDWFLRPGRRLAAYPEERADPAPMRVVYGMLPVLVCAGVVRLLRAERLDFSVVLVLIAFASGVVYGLDALIFRRVRLRSVAASGKPVAASPEPGTVDYARSFFPVALIVLVLRAFIFEPFRIPSDSMMPTLQDGDFILVNKYAYGLRLPVLNTKIVDIGEPMRGDVVVFRYPPDPAINYIKRLVGLPGDKVRIESDHIFVNGKAVEYRDLGKYSDGCYENMSLAEEYLGEHRHKTLYCNTSGGLMTAPLPSCGRSLDRGYVCPEGAMNGSDSGDREIEVPAGQYLMIGDNRDNSSDGRVWGFVPEANLVGGARRIWFNWDMQRSGGPMWSRIGTRID